jgi:hypothetical protein
MQVLVSFSTIMRLVLWLALAGILAGVLLVNETAGPEPAGSGEEVVVHADAPARPAARAIW